MGIGSRCLEPHRTYFSTIGQRTQCSGFFDDTCKEFYLRRLLQCQRVFHVQLHAYLLLDNRMFLMFTPETPSGFSAFTKFLAKSYNSYYSIRFERRVHAWQNSTTTCELSTDNLIRDCQKFIERYVIKHCDSMHPGEYHYSSYCANAFSLNPRYLSRHRAVEELLNNGHSTLESYREFVATEFREGYEQYLQSRLLHGQTLFGKRDGLQL